MEHFTCLNTDLTLINNKIEKLQNLPQELKGSLYIEDNCLTDLQGAPQIIHGDFSCKNNKITSLRGVSVVKHSLYASGNQIKNLNYMPYVEKDIYLENNRIKTLKGIQKIVSGSLVCNHNQLKSFLNFPQEIKKDLYVTNNEINSLEGFPLMSSDRTVLIFGNELSHLYPDIDEISSYEELLAIKEKEKINNIVRLHKNKRKTLKL